MVAPVLSEVGQLETSVFTRLGEETRTGVAGAVEGEAPRRPKAVKLLDLLTNRYHVGVLREARDGESVSLELPRPAPFSAGQRVRFIIADEPLVSRRAMRFGTITEVSRAGIGMRLSLALRAEAAAA